MPLYDYRCADGHVVELYHKIAESPEIRCETIVHHATESDEIDTPCGKQMERMISPPSPTKITDRPKDEGDESPIFFEYVCEDGHAKEVRHKRSESFDVWCEQYVQVAENARGLAPCGKKMQRRIGSPPVHYRAPGFATVDRFLEQKHSPW